MQPLSAGTSVRQTTVPNCCQTRVVSTHKPPETFDLACTQAGPPRSWLGQSTPRLGGKAAMNGCAMDGD